MPSSFAARLIPALAFLLLAVASPAASSWRPATFPGGHLDAWWVHSDQATLYARAADQWLRSDDGGRIWQALPRPPFVRFLPTAVHLHPSDPQIVAERALDGDDVRNVRYAFSRDGGVTWTLVDAPGAAFESLGFDHRGRFFLTGNGELWRTDDLGATWIDVSPDDLGNGAVDLHTGTSASALFIGGQPTWRVSFDGGQSFRSVAVGSFRFADESFAAPADVRRLLVPFFEGYASTTDGFATWRELDVPGRPEGIQFHPRQARWRFAREQDPASSSGTRVHISRDDGATWTPITLPDADPESPLTFDPCDDTVAYARRRAGWGWTRFSIAGDTAVFDAPTPQLSILDAIARTGGCELLTRTRAGLYSVTDGGATWRGIGLGLPTPWIRELHIDPRDPQRAWAATDGGLATTTDAGRTWSMLPALAGRPIAQVLPSAEDDRLLLSDPFGNLLTSPDGGESFETSQLRGGQWVADPFVDGAVLLLGAVFDGWGRLEDYGDEIIGRSEIDGEPSAGLRRLAFDPSTAGRVYALDLGSTLYTSTDGGLTFTATGVITGLSQSPRGITVDRGGHLFVWTAGQLVRSNDGGTAWTPIQLLPTSDHELLNIASLVADRHAADTLYALANLSRLDTGDFEPVLLRSLDRGTTWSDWSTGSTGAPLALAQSSTDAGFFLLGSGRRPYWRDETQGDACDDSDTSLCLRRDRFEVTLEFGDPAEGTSRIAEAVPDRTNDSGLFTFFDPDNWELMIKVLDACGLNQRFWVLAAATTDRAYSVRVLDRATGEER
ncbi:MAG: hypothetical protein AAGE94_16280, partial [Acidobacteriota bacterium]